MKFTEKDLLDAMGLKVGDVIIINNFKYKIFEDALNKIVISALGKYGDLKLKELINENFKIIEDKIWDIDEIEFDDKFYFVDTNLKVRFYHYRNTNNLNDMINKNLCFKKIKYAKEYKKELLKFNEEYKKKFILVAI